MYGMHFLEQSTWRRIGGLAGEPGPVELQEPFRSLRESLSAGRVFGEPVERDGITVIPAATVIGGGGGGGGSGGQMSEEGDGSAGEQGSGLGMGFGGVAWAAGAFEIKEGRVTWRPAVDLTRVLLAAVGVALVLAKAVLAARKR